MTTARAVDRLIPPDRRRRRGLLGEGGVSLVLHAAIIAALILGILHQKIAEAPAEAPVSLVFEGPGPQKPGPTPQLRRSNPSSMPDIYATEPAEPGASPSRPAAPRAAPPQLQTQPHQAQPTESSPEEQTPPLPPGTIGLPSPPPRPQRHAARPAPASPASPFAALSTPMTMSLAGRPPPPATQGRSRRGIIDPTLAPTDANNSVLTRYPAASHALGNDWEAAFDAYVNAHKYYPLAAAVRGEDGVAVLRLTIERDGTVTKAELEVSSGSPRLDDAWISLFRGRKVPPFSEGTIQDHVTFSASMDYQLLYGE